MAVTYKEIHLPHTYFTRLGKLTNYDIELMERKYPYAMKTDEGYPLFGMLRAMNEERKAVLDSFGVSANTDLDDAKLDNELKVENIQSKRILNQLKMGFLIPKAEASDRVKKVFGAVMNVIKVGIKNAAYRVYSNKPHLNSQRDIEIILTDEWNGAITELKDGAKVISWSEDGSSKVLRTRLSDLENDDPEFTSAVKGKMTDET